MPLVVDALQVADSDKVPLVLISVIVVVFDELPSVESSFAVAVVAALELF